MSDRIKKRCENCNRRSSGRVIAMEVDGKAGRTVLGRKVDLLPRLRVWGCPHCYHWQVVNLTLPLDPDRPILAAYERKFGPADDRVIAALAAVNDQFIFKFGDDWATRFGMDSIERLLSQVVEVAKNQFGDEWTTAIQEIEFSFVEQGGHDEHRTR